jgi:CRP-like cAMP-binding protein
MFYINEKGIEQTTQFAIENWWMADYMSFGSQTPSSFYIQAVENSDILSIDFHAQEKLLEEFPQLERYFRIIFQRAYASSQLRIKYLYDFSKEELYDHFNTHFPDFVQRIPQYMLASYLGFTPEYLSELRKKKLS